MKKYISLIFAVTLVSVASCKKEEIQTVHKNNVNTGLEFVASFNSKTSLSEGTKVVWSAGDAISVNGIKFVLKSGEGTGKAIFTKENMEDNDPQAPYSAIYPASISSNGGIVLPSVQNYNGDDISAVNPMFATGSDAQLYFSNVCGMLKITVAGLDGTVINQIRVSAKEAIHGTATIIENTATVQGQDRTDNTITLNLGETGIDPTDKVFYVALPAHTYTNLSIEARNDKELWSKNATVPATITRNHISSVCLDVRADENGFYPENLHHGYKVGNLYWADRNIGATKIIAEVTGKDGDPAFGKFYAWGSDGSDANTGYQLDEYPYSSFMSSISKNGGSIPADSGHDTARELWGGDWRMATQSEFETFYNSAISRGNGGDSSGKNFKFEMPGGFTIYFPRAGHYTSEYRYNLTGANYAAGFYFTSTKTGDASVFYMFASKNTNSQSSQAGYNWADSIRPVCE